MSIQIEDLKKALQEERFEDLREQAQVFIESYPENSDGYLFHGKASLGLNDPNRAIQSFNNTLMLDPSRDEPHFFLAQIAQADGDLFLAKQHYKEILKAQPNHAIALTGFADLCFAEEFYEDAIHYYKQVLDQGDYAGSLVAKCAQAYLTIQDGESALNVVEAYPIEQFNEAVSIVKRTALMYLKKDDGAFRESALLYENVPDNPKYALEYANGLTNKGDHRAAEVAYSRAISADMPEDQKAELYLSRANTRIALEDTKGALNDLDLSIAAKPLDYSYRARAELHLAGGDKSEALEDLNAAIKLSPGTEINYLQRAHLQIKLKQPYKAIKDFVRLLKFNKHDSEAYYGLGVCYLLRGEKEKAFSYMQVASSLSHQKAKDFLTDKFPEEAVRLHDQMKQKFAEKFQLERATNEASSILQKAFGKLWVPDLDRTIVAMGEAIYQYPAKLVEDVLDLVAKDMFWIMPEAILLFEGTSDPIEAYYKITLESPHAVILELQPTKGGLRSQMRMYETHGRIVFTYPLIDDQEVAPRYFRAVEIDSINADQKKRLRTKVVAAPYVESIEDLMTRIEL